MRVVLLVVVVIAVVTIGLLGYDRWTGRQERDVAVPDDGASPNQVVTAYLDALDAHDCRTARVLAGEAANSWCPGIDRLGAVHVSQAVVEPESPGTTVATDFVPRWRPFHGDGTVPNGHTVPWSFTLERAADDGPWRITSQGQG